MMTDDLPSIDKMMELAQSNPEALENIRVRAVERLIERAPDAYKRRLRGLQFEIDCQRRLHKTPMGACVSISTMMLNSLNKLNDALNESFQYTPNKAAQASQDTALNAASLLQFPSREASKVNA